MVSWLIALSGIAVCISFRLNATVPAPLGLSQGGGGKAPTMTMTAWNLPHGQWSEWLFCVQTSWLNRRFTILTI